MRWISVIKSPASALAGFEMPESGPERITSMPEIFLGGSCAVDVRANLPALEVAASRKGPWHAIPY
jgi:hypothetical protein